MPYIPHPVDKEYRDVPQLVKVARFAAPKDHTTLLNALATLKDRPWHLNLIGAGDDLEYRALAKSLGIEERVTFHGQRTDIDNYLLTQDIFLLISDWEGFPRSIIEAMRSALPVITTRVGGCPESVSQFQSGYIIPKQDPKALATALSRLIDDPLRRATMGEVGRKRYERYFTFDIMAYKTLNIYETVLGRELSKPEGMQEPYLLKDAPQ
jgi:glycosyltransferase involved in cell wall biosynthesis